MRRIVKSSLHEIGVRNVEEAPDGPSALSRLRAERFDLVLLDWNMPSMPGIEVLRAIRRDPDTRLLPVLMITAELERANVIEAARAGVSAYIAKPFTTEILRQKIATLFPGGSEKKAATPPPPAPG